MRIEKQFKVTSRQWQRIPERGPIFSINADHRVDVDIDKHGDAWARIARGNDDEVEITLTLKERV